MSKVFFCVGRLKSSRPSSRLFDGRRLGRQGKQKKKRRKFPFDFYSVLACPDLQCPWWYRIFILALPCKCCHDNTRDLVPAQLIFYFTLLRESTRKMLSAKQTHLLHLVSPTNTRIVWPQSATFSSIRWNQHFKKFQNQRVKFRSNLMLSNFNIPVSPQQNFGLEQWTDVLKCVKQAEETLPPLQCRQMFLLSTANIFSDRKQF